MSQPPMQYAGGPQFAMNGVPPQAGPGQQYHQPPYLPGNLADPQHHVQYRQQMVSQPNQGFGPVQHFAPGLPPNIMRPQPPSHLPPSQTDQVVIARFGSNVQIIHQHQHQPQPQQQQFAQYHPPLHPNSALNVAPLVQQPDFNAPQQQPFHPAQHFQHVLTSRQEAYDSLAPLPGEIPVPPFNAPVPGQASVQGMQRILRDMNILPAHIFTYGSNGPPATSNQRQPVQAAAQNIKSANPNPSYTLSSNPIAGTSPSHNMASPRDGTRTDFADASAVKMELSAEEKAQLDSSRVTANSEHFATNAVLAAESPYVKSDPDTPLPSVEVPQQGAEGEELIRNRVNSVPFGKIAIWGFENLGGRPSYCSHPQNILGGHHQNPDMFELNYPQLGEDEKTGKYFMGLSHMDKELLDTMKSYSGVFQITLTQCPNAGRADQYLGPVDAVEWVRQIIRLTPNDDLWLPAPLYQLVLLSYQSGLGIAHIDPTSLVGSVREGRQYEFTPEEARTLMQMSMHRMACVILVTEWKKEWIGTKIDWKPQPIRPWSHWQQVFTSIHGWAPTEARLQVLDVMWEADVVTYHQGLVPLPLHPWSRRFHNFKRRRAGQSDIVFSPVVL